MSEGGLIPFSDLLWTLRGATSKEVVSRIAERDDEECWSAYDGYAHNEHFTAEKMRQAADWAATLGTTAKVMPLFEADLRGGYARCTSPLRWCITENALAAAIELYALLIEGFVRMGQRGCCYPEHTPYDLARIDQPAG